MDTSNKTPAFLANIPHEFVCCDNKTKRPRGVGLGWSQLEAALQVRLQRVSGVLLHAEGHQLCGGGH